MLLGGIVVHKAVGAVAALRLLVQIRKERGGGSARADDGGRCARGGMALRAYDPTSVDTVGEAVGQHDEQRDRRAGQRTGDPDIAHAGEQVDRGVQEEAEAQSLEKLEVFQTLGIAPERFIGVQQQLEHEHTCRKQPHVQHQIQQLDISTAQIWQEEQKITGRKDHCVQQQHDQPAMSRQRPDPLLELSINCTLL